ncbi:unnamed protein product [Bursaphelenchus okinawaensis]|uniref:Nucleoporin GLE1 n=1 Tax=Bursaphelenchus okinawaensis TaxID=465554 RepID=A0A811KSQ1_9BILA|nr:unnamed protein product [Bursaphelenchus okinawaensis]CAG9111875.1 unnamed protein product [Bursaphelenchus okinawaensis]
MLGRRRKLQEAKPFKEVEGEIRGFIEAQKEQELKKLCKTYKERLDEDLDASFSRDFEVSLRDIRRMELDKWATIKNERLNQSANKSLNVSFPSPKPSLPKESDTVEFNHELFHTKVLIEKLKASGGKTVFSSLENQPKVVEKALLQKTDSILKPEAVASLLPSEDASVKASFTVGALAGEDKSSVGFGDSKGSINLLGTSGILGNASTAHASFVTSTPLAGSPNVKQEGEPTPVKPAVIPPSLSTQQTVTAQPAELKQKFDGYIQKLVSDHKTLRAKLTKFRKEPESAKFCNSLKRIINEQIDVTTSKDYNDIKRISMAHNFFESLFNGSPVRGSGDEGEVRLDLANEIAVEYTIAWICERYTKLVATDGDLIETIATIFTMLIRLNSVIRERLMASIVSTSVLLKINNDEIIKKVTELGNIPAEESSVWLPEESNKVRLLLKVCLYTRSLASNTLDPDSLINTLLRTALFTEPVPISTCFILTAIIQIYKKAYVFGPQTPEHGKRIQELMEMDWTSVLASYKANIQKPEAWNVLESRQNVCLQQLKSAIQEPK